MEGLKLGGSTESSDSLFLQKKVELMIDANNKRVANELEKIKNMVNRLNDDVCEIKKKFRDNSLMPKQEPAITKHHVERNQNDTINARNSEPQKPRYGEYKPEDVSVNKFFYFGNKK